MIDRMDISLAGEIAVALYLALSALSFWAALSALTLPRAVFDAAGKSKAGWIAALGLGIFAGSSR
jgi:hypothetical protein